MDQLNRIRWVIEGLNNINGNEYFIEDWGDDYDLVIRANLFSSDDESWEDPLIAIVDSLKEFIDTVKTDIEYLEEMKEVEEDIEETDV